MTQLEGARRARAADRAAADQLTIAGRTFGSRLLLGSAGYPNQQA